MRSSKEVRGQAFVLAAGEVAYAGLILADRTWWPLSPVSGHSVSLVVGAMRAGLPQIRSIGPDVFGQPLAGWYLRGEPGAPQLDVCGPGGPFVSELGLDLPPGWWEAAGRHGALVLVSEYWGEENPGAGFHGWIGQMAEGGLLYGALISLSAAGPAAAARPQLPEDRVLTVVIDPGGFLTELAELVENGVLTLHEAITRLEATRELRSHELLGTYLSDEMLSRALISDQLRSIRHARFPYICMRLILAWSEALGCPDESAFWLNAAGQVVSAAATALSCTHDPAIYTDVEPVSRRRIQALRAAGEQQGLSEALVAAARLRLAACGPLDLGEDWYAGDVLSCRAAADIWDRYRADRADGDGGAGPDPRRCCDEAGELLSEAIAGSGGQVRVRALIACSQQQLIKATWGPGPVDGDSLVTTIAQAWEGIDASSDPADIIYLARFWYHAEPQDALGVAETVFSAPFGQFLGEHGEAVTRNTVTQGVELARAVGSRALLDRVLSWSEQLPEALCEPHARQIWEARLHCLPDDPAGCPGPDADIAALARGLREQAGHLTGAQRLAASVHLAAHARAAGQPGPAVALAEAAAVMVMERSPHEGQDHDALTPGLALLLGDVHAEAAQAGFTTSLYPSAAVHEGTAAMDYAAAGLYGPARACLIRLLACLYRSSGDDLELAIASVIANVPLARASADAGLGMVARDLVHAAMAKAADDEAPADIHLALHQAAKGADFTARHGHAGSGRFRLPENVTDQLVRLRAVEADADRAVSNPPAPGRPEPDLLSFADGSEVWGDGARTELAAGLRRHIDRMISGALLGQAHLEAGEPMSLNAVQRLLGSRTVLMTWFLPALPGWDTDHVILAITREDMSAMVVQNGREHDIHPGAAGWLGVKRHVLTDEAAAVRAAAAADPLFRDVSYQGARLLARTRHLFGNEDLLASLQRQGKDHLCMWPHGPLHYLPFHLYSAADGLIADNWTVSMIPSLTALSPPSAPSVPVRRCVSSSGRCGR